MKQKTKMPPEPEVRQTKKWIESKKKCINNEKFDLKPAVGVVTT